ncbi:AAA family ATPase, partial [Salmonella sp. s58758]
TALFAGPPGTGKTQFAAELAQQLERKLVVKTASDILSKWYGESERNVATMFRDCDPQEELLFLDEGDVLLSDRGRSEQRVDRGVTAEFLRWLEQF